MNAIARRRRQSECATLDGVLAGEPVVFDPSGALLLPGRATLIVSDLHLETGAAFARRGAFVPPYDTAETVRLLDAVIARHDPRRVVCLGDSFHDRVGAAHMPEVFRTALGEIMRGRDWLWISGNHDPEPPAGMDGAVAHERRVGPLCLRHEPSGADGEIAGHLHPRVRVAGARVHSGNACFLTDGRRMILPAFGITTGGLNVRHRAFAGLVDRDRAIAVAIGLTRIVPVPVTGLAAAA